jgi:lactate dehydrogenase-like 2-hydroxyacid dehydrogenase
LIVQTPSSRRRVLLSRRLPAEVERRIAERYDVVSKPSDWVLSDAELADMAKGCDYIFVSATDNVTRVVFEALAGTLRAVATLSVGFNHIDLEAARAHGVAVFYSPGVLSNACAEIALLLLLGAARRGHEAEALMRSGRWQGFAPTQLLGMGLSGRRAGILGMGRIGQAVAKRLRAFDVEVHYHNRNRLPQEQEQDAIYHATADTMLAVSDFFMICAPGTTGLANFLNREAIALLPADAIVVNVSRGDIVDDDALIESLTSGRLFAAGLDVFSNEPDVDPRYKTLSNVFLTPHIGSATVDTRNAMGFILLDGLTAFESGHTAENQLC